MDDKRRWRGWTLSPNGMVWNAKWKWKLVISMVAWKMSCEALYGRKCKTPLL